MTSFSAISSGSNVADQTASKLFKMLWAYRARSQITCKAQLEGKLKKLDKDSEHLLDCIVEACSTAVIEAFEKRIDDLQREK